MTTAARLCAACDVSVRDVTICTRCERQLSAHLADMPEHHRELKVALARQTRMTGPQRRRQSVRAAAIRAQTLRCEA